jgi:PAS domain S-box-containing protein
LVTRSRDFEDLINAIPALVARVDCNLQVLYSNDLFRRWFPSKDEKEFLNVAIGIPLFDQIQRHLGHVLMGHTAKFPAVFEDRESLEYLDVILTPQFDPFNCVSSIVFHASIVTEKMNDQRALHDYFENATIGLHWVNSEGIIVWANPAELKMLGYEGHEYVGQHISKFHKNQDCIVDILSRLAKGESLRHVEAEMLCKDGSSKFVSINSSVLWEGSKFIHTRCFTIDITAQKLAAEAVQESEQRFRIIADLVPLVIWTADENGMFTFLNLRWEELTGRKITDGTGSQWLNAVHPEDQPNIRESWKKSLSTRSTFEAKFRLKNGKGGHIACYANAIPRFDSHDKFIGYTGIIQDFSTQEHITASLERMVLDRTNDLRLKNIELSKAESTLKAKNAELEKINHELSSFAHVASHDLQEPLRKIQTFIERIIKAEGERLSEKSLGFMNKIENASSRMRSLIQDILLYSKANQIERQWVDLKQLIGEVVVEFEIKIEEKNAIIECIGDLPVVHITKFQFHQVFLNLISNALKFAQPGLQPHIEISSSIVKADSSQFPDGTDEYYDIAVADNGIGFEAEYAERIFEMFNRLHSGSEYEGTGIGLAICRKIVERHNGKMMASGAPGRGATFHIYLPKRITSII